MNDNQQIALVWGAIFFVVIGGISLVLWLNSSYVPINNNTDFCPTNGQITGHDLILVDQTDSLTDDQVTDLKTEVNGLKDTLAIHARLSIVEIGKAVEIPPLFDFSLCNPGRGDQINPLDQTPRIVQQQFEDKFSSPLDEVVNTFLNKKTEVHSPIMETIAEVTRLPSFNGQTPNRHLVIFSDLLQNTPQLSQYIWSPVTFAQFQASSGYSDLPDLSNTVVDIFYLPRPPVESLQTPQHQQFWADFFKASGASSVNWCAVGHATLDREVIECAPASNF